MTNHVSQLPGVEVFESRVHSDPRGSFRELFRTSALADRLGSAPNWSQSNTSISSGGVLRGIHYQLRPGQAKFVACVSGAVFDVAVDLRPNSAHFRCWTSVHLSAENGKSVWIPEGFGHGVLSTSKSAAIVYLTTAEWNSTTDRAVRWDDPTLAIDWPLEGDPVLSDRDASAPFLADAELPE